MKKILILGFCLMLFGNMVSATPLQILSQGPDGTYTAQNYTLDNENAVVQGRIWLENTSNTTINNLQFANLPLGFSEQGGSCQGMIAPQSTCYFELEYTADASAAQRATHTITLQADADVSATLQVNTIIKKTGYPFSVPYDYSDFHGIAHVSHLLAKQNTLYAAVKSSWYKGSPTGLYVSTDEGASWYLSGLSAQNISAMTSRDSTIYVGTDRGVFISTDNGATWSAMPTALPTQTINALTSNNTTTFAATNQGVFINSGTSQIWRQAGLINQSITAIAVNNNVVYAANDHDLFVSTDGGETWPASRTAHLDATIQAFLVQANTMYLATDNGIFMSNDQGKNWQAAGLQGSDINALVTVNRVFYATTSTNLYQGILAGNTINWSLVTNPLLSHFNTALTVLNNSLILGTNGPIYTAMQGDWQMTSPLVLDNAITSTRVNYQEQKAWYVGQANIPQFDGDLYQSYGQGLYRSMDEGATWQSIPFFYQQDVLALAQVNESLLVGTRDGVYRCALENFSCGFLGLSHQRVRFISLIDQVLYVGTDNGLFISIDQGNSWTAAAELNGLVAYSIATFKNIIFVGTNQGLFQSNKQRWQRVVSVDPTTHVLALFAVSTTDSLYLAGWCLNTQLNGVMHTNDLGKTWLGDYAKTRTFTLAALNNGILLGGALEGIMLNTNTQLPWEMINVNPVYMATAGDNEFYLVGNGNPMLLPLS